MPQSQLDQMNCPPARSPSTKRDVVCSNAGARPVVTLNHRPVGVESIVFGSEMAWGDVGLRHWRTNFDLGRYGRVLGGVECEVVGGVFEETFVIAVGIDGAYQLKPLAPKKQERGQWGAEGGCTLIHLRLHIHGRHSLINHGLRSSPRTWMSRISPISLLWLSRDKRIRR
jgi:hypothetical protein